MARTTPHRPLPLRRRHDHRDGAHDPRVGASHCRMCQRWSGGLFLCFNAEAQAVTVTGEVREFRSSPFSKRGFCPTCGSHLWFRDTDEGGRRPATS